MSLITLTTDFGEGSPYVAAMKGVMLAINAQLSIVDLSHAVAPQDVRAGARLLAEVTPLFPPGTLHVAVVDPGVGTNRPLIYAEIGDQRYVCPDKGLLSLLARTARPRRMRRIADERWFRHPVAATFHGRDILAPVAARLSLGLDADLLGPPHTELVLLDWPEPTMAEKRIRGEVASIDSFGNLITNITREMLAGAPTDESVTVTCDEHETQGIFTAYADQPPMTLIALIGSNDCLELAIVDDSAKIMLGVRPGTPVEVRW
jgi:S-adenosyl-L-methionine hydrolase (adenosine-forming)